MAHVHVHVHVHVCGVVCVQAAFRHERNNLERTGTRARERGVKTLNWSA